MTGVKKRKYYIMSTSEGCTTNLSENASYSSCLTKCGEIRCTSIQEADYIIINTCGYTLQQEKNSLKTINAIRKQYPDKKIIIGGCLPKISPSAITNSSKLSVFAPGDTKELFTILGHENTHDLPQMSDVNCFDLEDTPYLTLQHKLIIKLRPYFKKAENILKREFHPLHNLIKGVVVNNDFHLITVSKGCLGGCTYCGIKKAKGSLVSKDIQTIRHEFSKGIDSGKQNFWLLGDDIGCWGNDINLSAVDLLNLFKSVDKEFSLVITFFEPSWLLLLSEKLLPIFADNRIISINFPIQSGSNFIVKKMGRDYEVRKVIDCVKAIRKSNDQIAIKTNILVGFPGESWSDFGKTIVSIFYFDAIVANKYSIRPNTAAATYENQIPEATKNIRLFISHIAILIRHSFVCIKSLLNSKKMMLTMRTEQVLWKD